MRPQPTLLAKRLHITWILLAGSLVLHSLSPQANAQEAIEPTTQASPDEEASSQPTSAPAKAKKRWIVVPLPILYASSDVGVGGGLQTTVYDRLGNQKPYRVRYEFTADASSRLNRNFVFGIDKLGLLGGNLRVAATANFNRSPLTEFFGIGNETIKDQTLVEEGFYLYDRTQFGAKLSLRYRLDNVYSLRVLVSEQLYTMRAEPDSALRTEAPAGEDGGNLFFVGFGAIRDTRNSEAWPSKGGFSELSVRAAPPGLSSDPYAAVGLIARRYVSPFSRLVLAGRLAADFQFGDPSFFVQEVMTLDGIVGVGGGNSARGFSRARFTGKAKAIAGIEARATILDMKRFNWGLAAFADTGRALADYSAPLNGLGLHTGFGGGLRAMYEDAFVVRIEAAKSDEDFRIYFLIDHPY